MDSIKNQTGIFKVKSEGWGEQEKAKWLTLQTVKRCYQSMVVEKIQALSANFNIEQYGALSYDEDKYPLFLLKSQNITPNKPTVLITGGVHGYETSGVLGALEFAKSHAKNYEQTFNFLIAPCVSPWGFETINRWNPKTVDPNRSFMQNSPSEEAAKVMAAVEKQGLNIVAHIDLHETTDTDNSIFRPSLAARDGIPQNNWNIPDGFYLVDNEDLPQDDFQKAMIEAVEKVTHIAEPDENGELIGKPIVQNGVIRYPLKSLNLCTGFTGAKYTSTTEVYPDSPRSSAQNCIDAQVAACVGGLNYLLKSL